MKKNILLITLLSTSFLAACTEQQLTKLENLGAPPALRDVQDPTRGGAIQPVSYQPQNAGGVAFNNSLWQQGSKTFFRDSRATKVGDILKVNIRVSDSAAFNIKSDRKRDSSESLGVPNLFGYETSFKKLIPGPGDPNKDSLVSINGAMDNSGEGATNRKEQVATQVAAIVTQILPNGNLVISGKQEIRVNFEVREVVIDGIIRPEDIDSRNTIDSEKIAEARISYGGRGQITDVQQPRLGHQVIDILSPF